MKLYDLKAGINPRRVRIFLAEKGIEVPMTPIDMAKGENRTPEFLALNPMGTLPVLELDDGAILTEIGGDLPLFRVSEARAKSFRSTGSRTGAGGNVEQADGAGIDAPGRRTVSAFFPVLERPAGAVPGVRRGPARPVGSDHGVARPRTGDASLHCNRSLYDRGHHRAVRVCSGQEHRRADPGQFAQPQTLVDLVSARPTARA